MKLALYLRVSTGDQTVENQRPALEGWAAQRSHTIAAVYSENVSAWQNGHQNELSRLIADAQTRKFDGVLLWALDRLTRGGPLAILQLHHTLGKWGVRVFSYSEAWTEYPNELTPVILAIYGWVAQMESQRRSERTNAGIARAKAEGKRLGRPPGKLDSKKRHRRREAELFMAKGGNHA